MGGGDGREDGGESAGQEGGTPQDSAQRMHHARRHQHDERHAREKRAHEHGRRLGIIERVTAFTSIFLIEIGVLQVLLGEAVSGSVALTANGIDCIGDGVVSAIVWVGLHYLRRNPDKEFRHRHYRIETNISTAVSVLMLCLASYILWRSYWQFVDPQPVQIPALGAIAALVAAVIACGLGTYKLAAGAERRLSSLRLDGLNTLKDGSTSFLTVVSLVFTGYGYLQADAVAGFAMGFIIISIAFASFKEMGYVFADAYDVRTEYQEKLIRAIAHSVGGVDGVRSVRVRRSGPRTAGDVEIRVRTGISVEELARISKELQERSRHKIHELRRLRVIPVFEHDRPENQ